MECFRQANTKPGNGRPAFSQSHSCQAPVHLSFFGLLSTMSADIAHDPLLLSVWAVWAPSKGDRLWYFGGTSPTLLLCGWPGLSQPWSRVAPCPELRASVTARNLQLARSLLRALQWDTPYTPTCSLLLVIIYWYLWLTFCHEVTLSPITGSNSDGQLVRIDLSFYLLRLLSSPRFSHVVTRVGFTSFRFRDKINPKNENIYNNISDR